MRQRLHSELVDPVSALLDGPRARGAFVIRCLLDPPWAMSVRDEAPLTVVAVVSGEATITQGRTTARLTPGSVALVVGPRHYTVASDPELDPDVVIHPGQRCETLDGEPLAMSMRLGVRSWGHAADASTVLVTATYEHHSAISHDLLASLRSPAVVHRRHDDPLIALLADELVHDEQGQQALLDRLVDALTIDTVRTWYTEYVDAAPTWWHGQHDPIVGEALHLIHHEPARPWTIAALARAVGTSRANLARRFTDLVGEPVITYLTSWRLSLAADLITQPDATVTEVAAQVGYSSPFALSTAFKRRYGLSPHQHRLAALAALSSGTGLGGHG
jgi:AraC-like DNA-binding protein